jgi:hypothetical protein
MRRRQGMGGRKMGEEGGRERGKPKEYEDEE